MICGEKIKMNFKLLYVVVSSESDTYLEQAYLSMFSAKFYMPHAKITLLTDDLTDKTLIGNRKNILKYTDEYICIPLDPKYTSKIRSRLLKTNMRHYVEGDFLYIDSDTIICDDLSDLVSTQNSISGVYDLHVPLNNHPKKNDVLNGLRAVQAQPDLSKGYYNSGVLLVKDTPESYTFFTEWNQQYLKHIAVMTQDQPSLELVREMYPNIIHNLPDTYNTQILYTTRYIRKMKILHYFSSGFLPNYENKYSCKFCDINLLKTIKTEGEIPEAVKQLILEPEKSLLETAFIFPPTTFFESHIFRCTERLFQCRNKNLFTRILFQCSEYTLRFFVKLFCH